MLRPVHDRNARTVCDVQTHPTTLEEPRAYTVRDASVLLEYEGAPSYVLWDFSSKTSAPPVQTTGNKERSPSTRAAKRLRNR